MVDKIANMEPLGGRKPTELLTVMAKYRPKDDHHFFAYFFLQRLPREIRILLARDCSKDIQALAEKADELMALHIPQQHDITAIAPVADEAALGDEPEVAAAAQKGGRQWKKKWTKKQQKKEKEDFKSPQCHFHAVSQTKFLVDTGSLYSILPHRSRKPPHGPVLRAADGWQI
jgi:hypothetical protein